MVNMLGIRMLPVLLAILGAMVATASALLEPTIFSVFAFSLLITFCVVALWRLQR